MYIYIYKSKTCIYECGCSIYSISVDERRYCVIPDDINLADTNRHRQNTIWLNVCRYGAAVRLVLAQ